MEVICKWCNRKFDITDKRKKIIWITVGTGAFDPLFEKIDEQISDGKIKEDVVAQIGKGMYIPGNVKRWSRFADDIEEIRKQADIIICHGGAATLLENIKAKKKVIGIFNFTRSDEHQKELLTKFEEMGHILWCKDIEEIPKYIKLAKKFRPKKYEPPECWIQNDIVKFLR